MRPIDKLIAGYITFLTVVVAARGMLSEVTGVWLVSIHLFIAVLLFLFTRLRPQDGAGKIAHALYPLALLPVFYAELGLISLHSGVDQIFARDEVVQQWEQAIFGTQIAYDWIRHSPSALWSMVLHLAYVLYYPIILVGPIALVARSHLDEARKVLLATMIAFVACYVVFALYPVAGPNYAFEHPTGVVREVWSAHLVYWLLDRGSAIGTAFPSSHVAATVATTVALWSQWRRLSYVVLVPTALLVVATVYCQMHYGVDVAAGLAVGAIAGLAGVRIAA